MHYSNTAHLYQIGENIKFTEIVYSANINTTLKQYDSIIMSKRVPVTLDDDLHDVLMRLSKITGFSISSIIKGFIPGKNVFEVAIKNREAVKNMPEVKVDEMMLEFLDKMATEFNKDLPIDIRVTKKN